VANSIGLRDKILYSYQLRSHFATDLIVHGPLRLHVHLQACGSPPSHATHHADRAQWRDVLIYTAQCFVLPSVHSQTDGDGSIMATPSVPLNVKHC
jgi:hypothetical protein